MLFSCEMSSAWLFFRHRDRVGLGDREWLVL